jgi:hypothetical protein
MLLPAGLALAVPTIAITLQLDFLEYRILHPKSRLVQSKVLLAEILK